MLFAKSLMNIGSWIWNEFQITKEFRFELIFFHRQFRSISSKKQKRNHQIQHACFSSSSFFECGLNGFFCICFVWIYTSVFIWYFNQLFLTNEIEFEMPFLFSYVLNISMDLNWNFAKLMRWYWLLIIWQQITFI